MTEIKTNQILEATNLLSFRGKVTAKELESINKDMDAKVQLCGAKRCGNPITATYAIDGEYIDIEILMPLDKSVENVGDYIFKEKIKIVNAVVAAYKGHPSGVQDACNMLNQYMIENKLQPITIGYNVTKHMDATNLDNTEVDVYVGINPNIL